MCGIVAIIGKEKAYQYVLEGLKRLEYRGYDSSGIAYLENSQINSIKAVGKLENLVNKINKEENESINKSSIAIGHTRWATHGKVDINNAHPIMSKNKVAVVHNGIIENHEFLKKKLIKHGYEFNSLTDTEVIPHLFDKFIDEGKSFFQAGQSVLKMIKGAFAFATIHKNFSDQMFISRNTSPLVVGIGENFVIVGSDTRSISYLVKKIVYLDDGDYVLVNKNAITIYDKNHKPIHRNEYNVNLDFGHISKDGYRHFMEKEIFEQPSVLVNTISSLISVDNKININLRKIGTKRNTGLMICAAGTSYYAAIIAKYWIEKISNVMVNVELASEFRYRKPSINGLSAMIVISQSGESIDTLMAMREGKRLKLKTTSIVNVEGSTIDRESDYSIYTRVGAEIGVASTKSFTSQLTVLFLLALKLAEDNKTISQTNFKKMIECVKSLPSSLSKLLTINEKIMELAQKIKNAENVLFLGRGVLYPLALEGALKLKEISYIHAEGFAAGEMKHGPIALIEENLPVIMFLVCDGLEEKSISNLQEAISRGAYTILISDKKSVKKAKLINFSIVIPDFDKQFNTFFSPILMAIPAQLLAYHVARERGTDVDQPRNLAKSVTVE